MSAQRSLLIANELDELQKINAAIEELAEEENWSPDVTFQIGLAVEELGVNIVNYGHDDDKAHEISIVISSDDEAITIEIEDDGHAFNPLSDAPEPDLDAEVEDPHRGWPWHPPCAHHDGRGPLPATAEQEPPDLGQAEG